MAETFPNKLKSYVDNVDINLKIQIIMHVCFQYYYWEASNIIIEYLKITLINTIGKLTIRKMVKLPYVYLHKILTFCNY